jgi:hypothetical protein
VFADDQFTPVFAHAVPHTCIRIDSPNSTKMCTDIERVSKRLEQKKVEKFADLD